MTLRWNPAVHRPGILRLDAVDEVDSEVEVDSLVAHDVLELLADPGHPVAAVEGEDHGEAGIKEDPLHDHVVADEVFEELLRAPLSVCA